MNNFILCLISFQLTFGVSIASDETKNVILKTFSMFESNLTHNIDDSRCFLQLKMILKGATNSELWAIKIFDAWGKIPSGILNGNLYEFGKFDQCLATKKPTAESNTPNVQYCLVRINFKLNQPSKKITPATGVNGNSTPGLNIGVCVPDSCSPETLTQILNYAFSVSNKSASVLVSENLCQTNTKKKFNTLDIFTISFIVIITLLMVASTIYDVLMTRNKKGKILGLTAFSMYTNGRQIFQTNTTADTLNCLDGIRALTTFWLVCNHAHMAFIYGPVANLTYFHEWLSHVEALLLAEATELTDSFFLLSGLLVAWSFLKRLDKSNGKLNILQLYIHRYIRLTPSLAVLVLILSSLVRHFGSGPIWNVWTDKFEKPCQKYWWSTLLYVQNYVNPNEMCPNHSWFLAIDMQLFIMSPIIVYSLWRWRQKFVWIISIIILGSMVFVFTAYMIGDYPTSFTRALLTLDYKKILYYPTHTRMGAWLVGVLLGYILHNLRGKVVKISKTFLAIGWLVSIASILLIAIGLHLTQQPDHVPTFLERAFYESCSRVSWAISLSWIIFACVHGYGGPVNWFLSLPHWQPIAKLSYSIYLLQSPLIVSFIGTMRTPPFFSEYIAIHKLWGDLGKIIFGENAVSSGNHRQNMDTLSFVHELH